jgi:hypothetical protein
MHLISVLFPAPLSPTSAVTFPAYVSKSTPFKTFTGPKDLLIPRSESIGELTAISFLVLVERISARGF